MNDLSKRIAALSPEQQALLKRRLNAKVNQPSSPWAIQKRDRTVDLSQNQAEVSFGQQRMWFQDQLSIKSAVSNNVSISLEITGSLHIPALEQSLKAILQRHEVLRTTYQAIAGELMQIINPIGNWQSDWQLEIIDLQTLSDVEQVQKAEHLTQAQACQPFNLEADLLLRSTLLQLHHNKYLLLLTLHHITVDAWSIGIFFRELSRFYAAFANSEPSSFEPLPIQYADFAIWQRQYMQGKVLAEDLDYWKQQLHHAPDLLPLPSDRHRPAVQSFTGKTISFTIPKPLVDALREISQQNEATLFMGLVAALQTLLMRYGGQEDILIGAPIANRHHPEVENLIGCFINTLVLRTDLSGNPSFRTLLQRVRETVLGALAHQTLPFEKLVDELKLARNLAYAPLFQVMLVFQNTFSIENIELPNLEVEHHRIDNHTAQFDFTFHLVEADIGLIGKLEYNTDLFDEATIARMLTHFQTLLTGIVANPDRSLSALTLLDAIEQQQLKAWSQTVVTPAPTSCIHQLLESQANKTPNAIAVIAGDRQLTYQQLNQRANQLAHYLQKLGVKPDSLVALCTDRDLEMIVGLFGILKAGGAYVPIDPTYPSSRIDFILADAQVSVLVTQKPLVAKFPNLNASQVLLDADWKQIALESPENLEVAIQTDHLAYIIYTSGSTGQPKGVMIQHQSLVNYTAAAIAEYAITRSDRILQFASISFDAAAEEIFPCLASGATLRLRTEAMLSAIALFLETCDRWQISVLDLPTAFWHQMVTEMAAQNLVLPNSVRLVILGGEKALCDRFAIWQQLVKPHVRLVNSYGPTEATIVTTTIDLSSLTTADLAGRELPIGKPVRNASTYILDPSLQLTPIGISGELYIGGMGLARGYLNRPDLTAQAFITDPFSNDPQAQLYKTGDRVRYWADGTIEFLGRIDRQVKIRGFRIELGEIESLLTQHPEVQQSLVIDWADPTGDKRLVAYIVPISGYAPSPRSLRRFLEKRLPKYMIPTTFMLLSALQLNKNGKVDRTLLPVPELGRPELGAAFVSPRSAKETAIAQIFAEVLQMEQVGVEDDFFELGGHSLLATKLMSKLHNAFPSTLTIINLFQSPTVAGLAERVEQLQNLTATSDSDKPHLSMSIIQKERQPDQPIPLSFSQQYIWHMHCGDRVGAMLNSSIILRIKTDLTPAVMERSLNEIVRRHEILRTVFKVIDDRPMQFVLPNLHLPLVYTDLQHLNSEARESMAFDLAIATAEPNFDLATAPLIRTSLFQLAPQEHWLLLTMHHIITDGASFSLLLQELHTLIQAFSQNIPSPLADVPWQYADFALWQQQVYTEAKINQELNYWQNKLIDRDHQSPPAIDRRLPSRQARHYFAEMPASLVEEINALSHALGVTSFAFLLAGLKLSLAAWHGQRDIAVVTTIGTRNVPQTEQMLGCFINDVILRSQILPEQTGVMLIKQLQANIKEAIAHKDVPLERVIAHTKQQGDLHLMASITMTASTQSVEPISGWEIVEMQTRKQNWDDIPSELFSADTPLELYVEMSKPMRIIVNYSTDQFTSKMIGQLLTNYQQMLSQLVSQPEKTIFNCLIEPI